MFAAGCVEDAGDDGSGASDGPGADSDTGTASGETDRGRGSTPVPPAGSWPEFQGDRRNTGYSATSVPGGPSVEWRADTRADDISGAVVAEETVYVGTDEGTIAAVAAATGTERWTADIPVDSVQGMPALDVDSGALYAPGDDGLVRLDVTDGSVVWTSEIGASDPVLADGRLYVGAIDVAAVDTDDGSVVWRDDDIYTPAGRPPAVADGTVFVPGTESLFALDAERGTVEWEFAGGYGDDLSELTAPAVRDGAVHIAGQDGVGETVFSVDTATGEETSSVLLGDQRTVPVGSLALWGNRVVGIEEHGTVFSMSEAGGGWSRKLNDGVDVRAHSAPVAGRDHIVASTSAGTFAIDAEGGLAWRSEFGTAGSEPTVVDGWVFVADGNGTLVALH